MRSQFGQCVWFSSAHPAEYCKVFCKKGSQDFWASWLLEESVERTEKI